MVDLSCEKWTTNKCQKKNVPTKEDADFKSIEGTSTT